MSEVPDYIKPVIGVREWMLNREYLESLSGLYIWLPEGENTKAECFADSHEAPLEDCTCGWYAFYDLQSEKDFGDFGVHPCRTFFNFSFLNSPLDPPIRHQYGVKGVVSGWGKVILHDCGFRAEHMKIEALVRIPHGTEFPTDDDRFRDVKFSLERFIERASKIYDVPLIDEENVEEFVDGLDGIIFDPKYPEYTCRSIPAR